MTETEIWKDIPTYEDRYQASTRGRIRSIIGGRVRILTLNTYTSSPYYKVQLLDKDGHRKWLRVHVLIFVTFNGPIPQGLVIDHIDGQKTNNALTNLRAVTNSENCRNPSTIMNRLRRYHREGEFERRSAGQRRRFQRPEERAKILEVMSRARAVAVLNRRCSSTS